MDMKKKLAKLVHNARMNALWHNAQKPDEYIADLLMEDGVTVQERCHKAESVISKTGLMCTACHSDIDRDAVFCKYCGAKVMPQPPKGE